MKGYAMSGFEAGYGTPEIDGSFVGETWTAKNAAQVFMGVKTRNRATMDFLYDNDNLYFFGRVEFPNFDWRKVEIAKTVKVAETPQASSTIE